MTEGTGLSTMGLSEHCTCDFYRITPKAVRREHAPDCPWHPDRVREREGETDVERLTRQLAGAVEALRKIAALDASFADPEQRRQWQIEMARIASDALRGGVGH